jgi:hypothetical protein
MLCKLAQMTGGQVERVDPNDLSTNIDEFLNRPVIASRTVV